MKANPHSKRVTALCDVQRPLGEEERALLWHCRKARRLEEYGDYESARRSLSKWWLAEFDRPRTDGLHPLAAAELLLRAGTLTGHSVSAKLTKGAQTRAREFLEESFGLFKLAGHEAKAAEAWAELAWLRWRAGDFAGARCQLRQAFAAMGDGTEGRRAKAVALLRAAMAELDSGHPAQALDILRDAAPLIESCDTPVLLGKFYNNLGLVLMELGQETGREDFLDSAIVQYTAAGCHYRQIQEQAGQSSAKEKVPRLIAYTENNYGYVLFLLGEFEEAAERLSLAHKTFTELGDAGHAAEVRETQARLLLAQGRCEEAVRAAAEAVRALEAGERLAVLAVALTTMGVAQARSRCFAKSRETLERAIRIAVDAGTREVGGLAALSALEELREQLDFAEARRLYKQAHFLLAETHHYGMLKRLNEVAHWIIATTPSWDSAATRPANCAARGDAPTTRAALQLSNSRSPVLIMGGRAEERGLLARMIHEPSGRHGKFVILDCAASEQSSALRDFLGRGTQRAACGTLFLDEVQGLSRSNQERLLRLIMYGVIGRGKTTPQPERTDVRIVAGTSCDLSVKVERGFFLKELFEALSGHAPLRTLGEEAFGELRTLSGCLVKEYLERLYLQGAKLPETTAWVLRAPVSDATGVLARQFARMSADAAPQDGYLPNWGGATATASLLDDVDEADDDGECVTLDELVRRFEMRLVREALEAVGWNHVKAACCLGIKRQTLENRLNNRYPELLGLAHASL